MNARVSLQRVMRQGLNAYSHSHHLSAEQWQVCRHVLSCRTPVLGGVQLQCDRCDNRPLVYHACRDRHCPRCQRAASEQWCDRQKAQVLPVTYHHLVFTLPHEFNDWVATYPRQLYTLLFRSVWATLTAFGKNSRRLDGQMGATAVLHTWGQTLVRHVHLHVLTPGGAFGQDGHWRCVNGTYLFPVHALSRHFRGGFVSGLRKAIDEGRCPHLQDPQHTRALLEVVMHKPWVVYSKPVLHDTGILVDYLGRYTHRIALSDSRLHRGARGEVLLWYKDYRDHQGKLLELQPQELIRRYLLHVLPKGFMRVRHYGFLANRCRKQKLGKIREAIDKQAQEAEATADVETQQKAPRQEGQVNGLVPVPPLSGYPCNRCRVGRLHVTASIGPQREDGG